MTRARPLAVLTGLALLLMLLACVREIERPSNPTTADPTATSSPTPTVTATATSVPPPVATPTPTATPSPTRTATPLPPTSTPSPTPTATPTATATPTRTPVPPTPGPLSTPVGGSIGDGLFLKMVNVPKESIVHTETISLSGLTRADAVVSVNGVLVDVDSTGAFTATVTLQAAPNLIEIVASDFRGNKVSAVLTIIYIP